MSKKGKNIYKRKDGRWEGRYIKEYGLSGKIRYGYVYGKTFREAREKQEKAQADLLNHSTSASYSKQNLAVFCEEWLLLNQTVQVGATMQRLQLENPSVQKTAVTIDDPKTLTSKRTIPLMPQTVELCKRMGKHPPQAFVLTGQIGCFMEPRNLQYRFKKYTQECGLSDVNFHALRHTFATRCVEVDFEIKSLSEILGHASVQVTLDRYVHSSMELKRENMNKLPAIGF